MDRQELSELVQDSLLGLTFFASFLGGTEAVQDWFRAGSADAPMAYKLMAYSVAEAVTSLTLYGVGKLQLYNLYPELDELNPDN